MRQTGYTRASTLGPIAEVVTATGGSIERVFRRAELPIGLMESPDTLLPLRDHCRLLAASARELADEAFAARLGRKTTIAGLGVYGKWVTQAPTLLEAIHRAGASLPNMLQSATRLILRRRDEEVVWSYELGDPAKEGRPQNEMLAIWYMIAIVRHFAGARWLPSRVMLGGLPASARRSIGEQMGADTVLCDGPGSIVFDQRLLMTVNPRLFERDGLDADEIARIFDIPAPDDLPGNIGVLIELELLGGRPTLDDIVRRAGLSKRTLQRRLADLGLSYADLLRDTLQRRAIFLLRQKERSITEIAAMLGYRDPAHFSRAFEKWAGVAPSRWRESARAGE
ncbi:AraC family transcriptional regulator ligand-binding domain-containing protein [Methylosinus sp. H3A]|uniref:AraC family transcriptional regulator n=1 Tax=Methylosinus sp. H3A TaxID=2785786 RepID=UPI0018C2F937|nr:AraC family transcriptional regulator [Methylosinus sp. H3A]MBG0810963.1 AraC family transcriptional regulator ligand-binding domain-containing protein [Methylosinus sp. H3A]